MSKMLMTAEQARIKQAEELDVARSTRAVQEQREKRERERRIADLLVKEVPFQLHRIATMVAEATKKPGNSLTVSMNADLGGIEVLRAVESKLHELGYGTHSSFSPGEPGRAAYDEMGTPDSWELTISW